MRELRYPSVELVQSESVRDAGTHPRGRRWKVFLGALVVAVALGLAFVYGRTPVYRASVSVLTVKPKAVDLPSADADVEHVAIQERLLLGEELLDRLSRHLSGAGDGRLADRDRLRGMLAVVAVPGTNLLELSAQGDDPALLQRVVNAWADTYQAARLEEIEGASRRTSTELEDEQRQLQARIEAARAELLAFREAHDIVSLERDENRTLSGLKGLNSSLNKARERLVEARARRSAVEDAIARGETVVPSEHKAEIARMRVDVERSSARLAVLQQKYTDVYLARDPAYRDLPAEVQEKREALAAALAVARETVRHEAQQAEEAARASVVALENQLEADQRRVQQFTERFKEFKALEEGLATLERLAAERAARLAQIEVRDEQKYPPIQVVQRARLPTRPVSPDYERDLAIALTAALGLALLVTWLTEYLGGPARPGSPVPVVGVRISQGSADPALVYAATDRAIAHQRTAPGQLAHQRSAEAPPPTDAAVVPRELSVTEIEGLLGRVDPPVGALATLVLSGIAPYELPLLTTGSFDRDARRVGVPGPNARELDLDADSWHRIEPLLALNGEARAALLSVLDIRLATGAREAGVPDPASVTALALWLSYIAYLLRRGIDDATLRERVGPIPTEVRRALTDLQLRRGDRDRAVLEYTHPALAEAGDVTGERA